MREAIVCRPSHTRSGTAVSGCSFVVATLVVICHSRAFAEQDRMLVRISEIQVDPEYLKDYTAILAEEAEAAVRLEAGVVSIFPMYQKRKAD